jgi:molecular chaperone GrpE
MAKEHIQELDPTDAAKQGGRVAAESPESATQKAGAAEQPAAGEPGDEVERLRQELEVARTKLADHQEAVLRAHAELENLRKRALRDVENAHKFALDRFVAELLPVLDSMELGIAAAGTANDADSLREGMDLTLKKFQDTLAKFGVATIDPQGEKFNPEQHEAVSMQEIEGAAPGTVVTVMQKGYALNGRLVRPAMVVVAR